MQHCQAQLCFKMIGFICFTINGNSKVVKHKQVKNTMHTNNPHNFIITATQNTQKHRYRKGSLMAFFWT